MGHRGRRPGSGTVNDAANLARIMRLRHENPGMSRRQAIIKVAGEGSLRRLETKMTKDRGVPLRGLEEAILAGDDTHAQTILGPSLNAFERDLLALGCQVIRSQREHVVNADERWPISAGGWLALVLRLDELVTRACLYGDPATKEFLDRVEGFVPALGRLQSSEMVARWNADTERLRSILAMPAEELTASWHPPTDGYWNEGPCQHLSELPAGLRTARLHDDLGEPFTGVLSLPIVLQATLAKFSNGRFGVKLDKADKTVLDDYLDETDPTERTRALPGRSVPCERDLVDLLVRLWKPKVVKSLDDWIRPRAAYARTAMIHVLEAVAPYLDQVPLTYWTSGDQVLHAAIRDLARGEPGCGTALHFLVERRAGRAIREPMFDILMRPSVKPSLDRNKIAPVAPGHWEAVDARLAEIDEDAAVGRSVDGKALAERNWPLRHDQQSRILPWLTTSRGREAARYFTEGSPVLESALGSGVRAVGQLPQWPTSPRLDTNEFFAPRDVLLDLFKAPRLRTRLAHGSPGDLMLRLAVVRGVLDRHGWPVHDRTGWVKPPSGLGYCIGPYEMPSALDPKACII